MTTPLNLIFNVKSFSFENVPGDVLINIVGFLKDTNGAAFLTSDGKIDTFTTTFRTSGLPPSGYDSFLISMAQATIATKYNTSISGTISNSAVVDGITSVASLIPLMSVYGYGVPISTVLTTIINSSSIRLSQSIVQSIIRTGTTALSSTTISSLSATSDLIPSVMSVSDGGVAIPNDTTLSDIINSSSVHMSNTALDTGPRSITFALSTTQIISFTVDYWNIDYTDLTDLTTKVNFGSL